MHPHQRKHTTATGFPTLGSRQNCRTFHRQGQESKHEKRRRKPYFKMATPLTSCWCSSALSHSKKSGCLWNGGAGGGFCVCMCFASVDGISHTMHIVSFACGYGCSPTLAASMASPAKMCGKACCSLWSDSKTQTRPQGQCLKWWASLR